MRTLHGRRRVCLGLATTLAAIGSLVCGQARAVNIAWVSFHAADNAPSTTPDATSFGTMAPDVGYTNLLTAAGHTVTRFVTVNEAPASLATQLNTFDLVIAGRGVDSAHFQADTETAHWNTQVTKPMITMSGFIVRNSRLGFMDGEGLPDTTGPVKLTAVAPGHPIFAGIALSGGLMVNDYSTAIPNHPILATPQRGFSANTGVLDAGGTLIASVDPAAAAAANGVVIAEWAAGAVITNVNTNTTDTLGGRRLIFNSGSREQATGANAGWAGILDLTADGQQMFRNAVLYMAGDVPLAGDVNGDELVNMDDFTIIKNNFQKTVTGRTFGDLTGDLKVDWPDFRQWKTAFNAPAEVAGAAIPEPASALMALLAGSAVFSMARCTRRRCA